jgi:hypothetical protein
MNGTLERTLKNTVEPNLPEQRRRTELPTITAGGDVAPIIPKTYAEVVDVARTVCQAMMAPKFKNDISKVTAVIMSGLELGLKPMASLRLFWLTPGGQPTLDTRGMLAVVDGTGLLEKFKDRLEGEGENRRASVTVKRKGRNAITRTFSVADAKRAGLAGKDNYNKWLDRMLWNRATSFALNDAFADVLGGLYAPEELGGPLLNEQGEMIDVTPKVPETRPTRDDYAGKTVLGEPASEPAPEIKNEKVENTPHQRLHPLTRDDGTALSTPTQEKPALYVLHTNEGGIYEYNNPNDFTRGLIASLNEARAKGTFTLQYEKHAEAIDRLTREGHADLATQIIELGWKQTEQLEVGK